MTNLVYFLKIIGLDLLSMYAVSKMPISPAFIRFISFSGTLHSPAPIEASSILARLPSIDVRNVHLAAMGARRDEQQAGMMDGKRSVRRCPAQAPPDFQDNSNEQGSSTRGTRGSGKTQTNSWYLLNSSGGDPRTSATSSSQMSSIYDQGEENGQTICCIPSLIVYSVFCFLRKLLQSCCCARNQNPMADCVKCLTFLIIAVSVIYGTVYCICQYLQLSDGLSSKPDVNPGNCWAFSGSEGQAVIKLPEKVQLTAVTVQHISKAIAFSEGITSALKDFLVYGLNDETKEEILLGTFMYDTEKELIQTFQLKNEQEKAFQYVKIKVQSNWGNPEYTCIYRVRVHGRMANINLLGKQVDEISQDK
ncbi:hypothetical protein Chor_007561 [Crotalus horridus]